MIQANEIILFARSRLGDKDTKRWSDEELIDLINSSLSDISCKLEPFTHKEFIIIKKNQDRYKLPFNILRVLSVNYKNVPLSIKSFEYLMQNRHNIDSLCVCFDEQSFFLYPFEKFKVGEKIELYYKYIEQIKSKQDFINISVLVKKALEFHTLHLAYQVNTSEKNINKSNMYLNLYDKTLETLKVTYFKNKHSKKLKNKFRGI